MERKKCPQCGYANRTSAKVCANCAYRFVTEEIQGMRKFCTRCGQANRIRARVCTQCGQTFHSGQKWCPQCGQPRRSGAKVCSRCGYTFRRLVPVEPPVKPFVDAPITLPPQFGEPTPLPPERETPPVPATPPRPTSNLEASGEPAPFISNDELNQLRGKGIFIHKASRKGRS